MLRACVDIGSNTTRLLVAEVEGGALRETLEQKSFTRVARALGPDGEISAEKLAEVARVVATQAAAARALGAQALRIVATGVIRAAPNGEALCAAVRAAAGVEAEIIPAEEEARLAFAGATATLPERPEGPIGVVDVGGGSSELVVGTIAQGATWSASLPVGSGLLAAAYLRSDPPARDELRAVRRAAARAFEGLAAPRVDLALAVGGSATSLRRLVGPSLDADTLAGAQLALCGDRAQSVARRLDLDPERVLLLPAGMAILEEASRAFGVPLHVARGGLREGVLLAGGA